MNTLKLDNENWDLTLDAGGNLAVATGHMAIAQDVASTVRLFKGELWYATDQGVPYFEEILGQLPSLQFMKAKFIAAGMTVPGVESIKCFLTGPGPNREIGGQLQIMNDDGVLAVVETTTFTGNPPWYVSG